MTGFPQAILNPKRLTLTVFFISLLHLLLPTTSTFGYNATDIILLDCGAPSNTTSQDGRNWDADARSIYSSLNHPNSSFSLDASHQDPSVPRVPYFSALIIQSKFTYSFHVSPGSKFVRLYFYPEKYSNFDMTASFFSVTANSYTLLKNFSARMHLTNEAFLIKEFIVTVWDNEILNVTFIPSPNSYAFINGIEIVSMPSGLYLRVGEIPLVTAVRGHFFLLDNTTTSLETLYRLNVGGNQIENVKDTGMYRTWSQDGGYLVRSNWTCPHSDKSKPLQFTVSTPAYTAPKELYTTSRMMSNNNIALLNLKANMTWKFSVDVGFNYLIRLHFCELLRKIKGPHKQVFDIFINNQVAQLNMDVFFVSGGNGFPMYRDYIVMADNRIQGRDLWLALHPKVSMFIVNAFLNGLEIFKLNQSDGNLAGPNPEPIFSPVPADSPKRLPTAPAKSPQGLPPAPANSPQGLPPAPADSPQGLPPAPADWLQGLPPARADSPQGLPPAPADSPQGLPPAPADSPQGLPSTPADLPQGLSPALADSPLGPIMGAIFGGFALFYLLLCFFIFQKQRKLKDTSKLSTTKTSPSLPSDLCRRFSIAQIQAATQDFDDQFLIGSGGFGNVYKGIIDGESTTVAIKRLNSLSRQGAHEFHTEIAMLSKLRHMHLVSLIGYCDDHGEMILVYDYMPRGTLRDHLDKTKNSPLSWKQRLEICIGAARGLHYLHKEVKPVIIHRDVKSSNILLDENYIAKVSDFGLSKLGISETHVSTVVKGSFGYIDPEYYRLQWLTEKSDGYSFGVVLFEVLSGKPAVFQGHSEEKVGLARWACSCYKKGTLNEIVDPYLAGQIEPIALRKFGEVAENCVRERGNERPTMRDIVWALEFILQLQETVEENTNDSDVIIIDELSSENTVKSQSTSINS